jgi:phenylpropionate dioxygenase-like ring-hydroxylating dioxygenase large terminal subunit
MSPDGISLDEHLGNAKPLLDRFVDLAPDGEIVVRSGIHKIRYGANWKMQLENSVDNYHANFVHETAFRISKEKWANSIAVSGDKSPAISRALGNGHAQLDFWPVFRKIGRETNAVTNPVSASARTAYAEALTARLGDEEAKAVLTEGSPHVMIFPNLFLINADIRVIQPVSVRETFLYQYPVFLKGAPKEMNTFRLRVHEGAYGPAGFVLSDDMDIFERNQAALEARANEWITLSRGIHRERPGENGTITSRMTDEATQRGQWRHYKKLMQRD